MRYTTEAATTNTLSASSSITLRDKDAITSIDIVGEFISATLTEECYVVVSFSQNPPGGTPEDFTMVDQEDVIAVVQVPPTAGRYWNGSTAVTYALPSVRQVTVNLATPLPMEHGDRIYLHVFSVNPSHLTDSKSATMIVHTKNQLTKTVRRR